MDNIRREELKSKLKPGRRISDYDYSYLDYTTSTGECPVCKSNTTAITEQGVYHTEVCSDCHYHKYIGPEYDITKANFGESVEREFKGLYRGVIRYKDPEITKEKERVLKNNFAKLFAGINIMLPLLDELIRLSTKGKPLSGDKFTRALREEMHNIEEPEATVPMYLWNKLTFINIKKPDSFAEAMDNFDKLAIAAYRNEYVRIDLELTKEEEKKLIKRFAGKNVDRNGSSLIKYYPLEGKREDLLKK